YIPSNGFFLISNTGDGLGTIACAPLTIGGISVNPDACWHDVGMPNHALQCNPFVPGPSGGCPQANNASGIEIGTNGGAVWTGMATAIQYNALSWDGAGA